MRHHDGAMAARKFHFISDHLEKLQQGLALINGVAVGIVQIDASDLQAGRLNVGTFEGFQRPAGAVFDAQLIVAHGDEGAGNLEDGIVFLAESACF